MLIRERLTNIVYELFISDGVLGYSEAVEQQTELDPIILDRENNKKYKLYIADAQLVWEETLDTPERFLELVDVVTFKNVEIVFYSGQLAWREIIVPTQGSIKKLFKREYYVYKNLYYNVDGMKGVCSSLISSIFGSVLSSTVSVIELVGRSKVLVSVPTYMSGLISIIQTCNFDLLGTNKHLSFCTVTLPNKYRVVYDYSINTSGCTCFLNKIIRPIKAIRKLEAKVVAEFDGYRDTKLPRTLLRECKGTVDNTNILIALGLFNKPKI